MMKHYPHHIGDFDRATRHLTRIERSVYRDLIELYYDTEQQLTLDVQALCRRIIARTNEESTAVEQVLNEFFTKTPTGWYHARCEQEIEAYKANNSQRARAGKASAEAKRLKKLRAINGESTHVEHTLNCASTDGNGVSTNQSTNQPINQEPIITAPQSAANKRGSRLPDDWVLPKPWGEWALSQFPNWSVQEIRTESEKFRDFWVAKSGKDAAKLDWEATWRNWCRNAKKDIQTKPVSQNAKIFKAGSVWSGTKPSST